MWREIISRLLEMRKKRNSDRNWLRFSFLALLFSFSVSGSVAQGLFQGGQYTIGGNPGPNNYPTIIAALDAMRNKVVQGSVTFDIRPGTYAGDTIPFIPRTTPTDRIVFQSESGSADSVKVTSSAAFGTLFLNGATYVTLKNLTIVNTNLIGGIGILLRQLCDHDSIVGCRVNVDSTASTNGGVFGILAGGTSGSGGDATNCSFVNNAVSGGWIGIKIGTLAISAPNFSMNVVGNSVTSFYNSGIVAWNADTIRIKNNRIIGNSLRRQQSSGILLDHCDGDFEVTGNYIRNASRYGMFFQSCSGTTVAIVANNIVAGGFEKSDNGAIGICLPLNASTPNDQGSDKLAFYFNSISVDATASFNGVRPAGFSLESRNATGTVARTFTVKNNIFSAPGGGHAIEFGLRGSATDGAANQTPQSNNNLYFTTGTELALWTSPQATLADLRTKNAQDANSLSFDPIFYSATDLHTANPAINNKGTTVTGITKDYDGETRNASTPDIGADEFTPKTIDLGLVAVAPLSVKTGANSVSCMLRNYGTSSLNGSSAPLSYSSDGGITWSAPESYTLTGLATFNTATTYTFATPMNLTSAGTYELCARINFPGVAGDGNSGNEKACRSVCTGIEGTFTVGGTAADFLTLAQAVASIPQCGITGPVTFNLRPGTYSEVVTIGPVTGTSAVNTITIQSETGKAEDVVIARPTSTALYAALNLFGANRIILRNLTIAKQTSSSSYIGVHVNSSSLGEPANDNVIENCIFTLDSTGSQTAPVAISIGKLGTSSQDPVDASRNIVRNNKISGGAEGVRIEGLSDALYSKGNRIENNIITGVYLRGIHVEEQDSILIQGNSVVMRRHTDGRGIFASDIGYFTIRENYVSAAGYLGIYVTSTLPGISRSLVANNMVAGGFATGATFALEGIHIRTQAPVDVFFNSSFLDQNSSNSGSNACWLRPGAGSRVKNNIFYSTAPTGYAYYVDSISRIAESDYNDLYATGGKFAYWNADQANLSSLQAASGKESHSVSVDPSFTSLTDLHTMSQALRGKGTYLSEVPNDIDGDQRKNTGPDIGADETPGIDIAMSTIEPRQAKLGSNTVKVTLVNNGIIPLKDSLVKLSYSSDNGTTWSTPESFTPAGLLTFGSSEQYTFITPWNVITTGSYSLCARINPPGLVKDANHTNELVCSTVCADSGEVSNKKQVLDFGTLQCNDAFRDSIVAIPNTGNYPVSVAAMIVQASSSAFSIDPQSALIPPASVKNFTVHFQPGGNEEATAKLVFSTFCGATDTTRLVGIKNTDGSMESRPVAMMKYASLACGDERDTTIVLKNTGSINLALSEPVITGTTFSLVDSPGPETLYPGDSIVYTVRFHPPANANVGEYTGTFDVLAMPCSLKIKLDLSARKDSLRIETVADTFDFGTLDCASTSKDSVIRLTNTGTVSVKVTRRLEGDVANFTVTPSSITIPPGQSTTFTVKFSSTSDDTYNADAIFTTTPCLVADTMHLVGTMNNNPTILATPARLDYDTIACGPSGNGFKDSVIVIKNTGPVAITFDTASIDAPGFQVMLPKTKIRIAPGDSKSYIVRFSPIAPGEYNATFSMRSVPPCNVSTSNVLNGTCNGTLDVGEEIHYQRVELSQNYPNPCTKLSVVSYQLSEEFPRGVFEVCDMMGRSVYRQEIVNPRSQITLDVSLLPAGLYCYALSTSGARIARMMIVIR